MVRVTRPERRQQTRVLLQPRTPARAGPCAWGRAASGSTGRGSSPRPQRRPSTVPSTGAQRPPAGSFAPSPPPPTPPPRVSPRPSTGGSSGTVQQPQPLAACSQPAWGARGGAPPHTAVQLRTATDAGRSGAQPPRSSEACGDPVLPRLRATARRRGPGAAPLRCGYGWRRQRRPRCVCEQSPRTRGARGLLRPSGRRLRCPLQPQPGVGADGAYGSVQEEFRSFPLRGPHATWRRWRASAAARRPCAAWLPRAHPGPAARPCFGARPTVARS